MARIKLKGVAITEAVALIAQAQGTNPGLFSRITVIQVGNGIPMTKPGAAIKPIEIRVRLHNERLPKALTDESKSSASEIISIATRNVEAIIFLVKPSRHVSLHRLPRPEEMSKVNNVTAIA